MSFMDDDFATVDTDWLIQHDIPRRILQGEFTDDQVEQMLELNQNVFILRPYIGYSLRTKKNDEDVFRNLVRLAYICHDVDSFTYLKDFIHFDEDIYDDVETLQKEIIFDVVEGELRNRVIDLDCLLYLEGDLDREQKRILRNTLTQTRETTHIGKKKVKAAITILSDGPF